MGRIGPSPAVLGLAFAMALVTFLEPTSNSLAYASAILALIALLGWVIEAREVAGPPPEVEPEEAEEERAAGPSFWPVVLALGIVGLAAGLVYEWEYGALLIATPLALGAVGAWFAAIRSELASAFVEPDALGPPIISGGLVSRPVPSSLLATQAAGGAAIAIERVDTKQVSRRSLLRITFWSGLAAGLAAAAASTLDFLYPRGIPGFGGVVSAGSVDELQPGAKKVVSAGKFWLVNLTQEQGGPGFLALWWKCPHLGCTVPWRADFTFNNKQGWFRCPCHGSTYTDAGVRVFGPAPRSLDMMELTIEGGRINVNTGNITKGQPDNFRFAVKV